MAIENGSPNRKRTSVAPHGPASPMSPRCNALRATWKPAAPMVMGTQSMAHGPSPSKGGSGVGGCFRQTPSRRNAAISPHPQPLPLQGKGLFLEPARHDRLRRALLLAGGEVVEG